MTTSQIVRVLLCCLVFSISQFMLAQTIRWSGREWKVTRGGMAGVAKGDPANVTIDGKGYLHLRIVKRDGQWTSAEVFTVEEMGFGTYQWIVEGDVYRMDPTTVLGLFPYGPVHHKGADAENEIDIEFSQWNKTCHGCDADFTVYPATGHHRPEGKSAWEDNFYVMGGTLTTARMEWSRERIVFTLMNGAKAIGETGDVIKTETYASSVEDIPQVTMPVGINLWCFKGTPEKEQEVVVRSFEIVAK
jgi:hypothetical protein